MEQCLQCFQQTVYVDKLRCANGMLKARSRVQVQYSRRHGGDNLWYTGTVLTMTEMNMVQISLDRTTVFDSEHRGWLDGRG